MADRGVLKALTISSAASTTNSTGVRRVRTGMRRRVQSTESEPTVKAGVVPIANPIINETAAEGSPKPADAAVAPYTSPHGRRPFIAPRATAPVAG